MTMVLLAATDPGGWLLSRPQLVFVAFAGAVWLFRLIKGASEVRGRPAAGRAEPVVEAQPEEEVPDEEEERTRRVREEIRRKIEERRPGAAVPARVYEERWDLQLPAVAKMPQPPAPKPAAPLRAAATVAPQAPAAPAAGPLAPTMGALWLEELRTRDSARRAIVVREILGPPVALR